MLESLYVICACTDTLCGTNHATLSPIHLNCGVLQVILLAREFHIVQWASSGCNKGLRIYSIVYDDEQKF